MKDEDVQQIQIDDNADYERWGCWSRYERGFYGPLLFVFILSKLKIQDMRYFHMDEMWSLWTKARWSKK